MTTEHLTEQELQNYSYLNKTDDDKNQAHLSDCNICKAQIFAYQTLYREIRQAEIPQIDVTTELFILDRIPEYNKTDAKGNWYIYGSLVAAALLILGTTAALWRALSGSFTGFTLIGIAAILVPGTWLVLLQLADMISIHRRQIKSICA